MGTNLLVEKGDKLAPSRGLVVVLLFLGSAALCLAQVLPLHAAGATTTEGRLEREVDVLLRVEAHHK